MTDRPLRPTELPLGGLATTYVQAGEALFLALLDDIAARVRAAHPGAEHLEVSLGPGDGAELHGVWSAEEPEIGTYRLLADPHDATGDDRRDGPLDLAELTTDLGRVLSGAYLYRWGLVAPHPVREYRDRRWVTLPPADRAATVADAVRRHVPDAASLICLFQMSGGKVSVGFERVVRNDGETVEIPCPRCAPEAGDGPWPHDVSHELAAVLAQLYVLPHLRSRHLTPCVDLDSEHGEQLWLLPLPTGEATPATR